MRQVGTLVGLTVIATLFAGATTAHAAAPSQVDGKISVSDTTCTWANATASDTPPNPATIDRSTVNLSCSGNITVSLTNNPTLIFDDTAGTATVDAVEVTGSQSGVTCGYRASNVSLTRDGSTRNYSGPFNASKTSGGIFCPGSASGTASVSFH